jgi:preprotein translocase subunit YajC
MFVTPAYAQAAGAAPTVSPLVQFLPFILIFVIMYFLLIRPQQKRMKEHRAMIEAIKKGDRIVTAGGLIAKVTGVGADDSDEITGEIAQGVKVQIVRSTVTAVLSKTAPANTN